MKKLSTYLLLVLFSFSAPSFADDISDFQIERISIGDSLLEYFSEQEIKNNKRNYVYKNNKFYVVGLENLTSFEIYDTVDIYLKTDDKKYLTHAIHGVISYEKNIKDCYKKMDEIVEELSEIFKEAKITDHGTYEHPADEYGKSKLSSVYFDFKSGDVVNVTCADWSKELEKKWYDHLRVSLDSNEYDYWINNEAY